jgi:para-aminobenzoate synthetase component 1
MVHRIRVNGVTQETIERMVGNARSTVAGRDSGIDGGEIVSLPYTRDARGYYAAVRHLPKPVWLDSGIDQASCDPGYDIIAADPYQMIETNGGTTRVTDADGQVRITAADPLDELRDLLGAPTAAIADLPIAGGAIGYLAYDHATPAVQPPGESPRPTEWPTVVVGLYDWVVIVDHRRRRCWFVRHGRDPRNNGNPADALDRLGRFEPPPEPASIRGSVLQTGMTAEEYRRGFERIQSYIHDGDCYQVNFAQRFVAASDADAWTLYQHMRRQNPAPFGALLEYPFGEVLSSSPEQFLTVRDGRVSTRPIKGTRPRGASAAEDAALARELETSAKDRAENLMIVDLLRNDLGRVCRPGSIRVPDLFKVESFATVHHLVSTVTGELADGADAIDLLKACFPGGSITGAPKRRAMQIIDELEPVGREIYCGSVFRLGLDGSLDSNITIRTSLMRDGRLSYWAGGGIVADSDCAAEYQESLDKAAAFLRLFD